MSELNEGVETSAPSLEESLAASFDGATSTETGGTTDKTTAPGSPASGDPNAALESPLEPPKHWSEVDRTLFGKAPRDIQQRWLDREVETERGLSQKFQEIARFKKERDVYDEILQPYQAELMKQGIGAPQFFKSLVGWQQHIQSNPLQGIRELAQAYGVDPAQLLEQAQQVDPKVSSLEQKLSTVESKFSELMQAAQQREHQSNLAVVQAFAEAKGEDGQPAHPFFDDVAEDIVQLMAVAKQAGKPITIEQAYNKAVRMNDSVFEKVQTQKTAQTAKQADAQRMAAVEKAKKAAVANTPNNAKGSAKKLTLEEELSARMEGTLN